MSAAEDVLNALADAVAERVANKMPQGHTLSEYVDQGTCGFDAKTFVRAARAQAFPASKIGRRWIAKRADVAFWIESRRPGFVKMNTDTDLTDLRKKLRRAS